jgi:hemolysin III
MYKGERFNSISHLVGAALALPGGAIWGLAIAGIILDALPRKGIRVVPVLIYLIMGWLCVFALDPIIAALLTPGFNWQVADGIFYTTGIVFYILDHWYPRNHGIWHLFVLVVLVVLVVLAGSISHYFSILLLY